MKKVFLAVVFLILPALLLLFFWPKPSKAQDHLIFSETFDNQASVDANQGTVHGAVSYVPGKVGNAADMGGSLGGGYITYPREGNYNIDQGRMEFWVKPKPTSGISQFQRGGLFDVGTLNSDSDILFINYDSAWIEFYGQRTVSLLPAPVDGWYQIKIAWRCSKSSKLPNFQSISVNGQVSAVENYDSCLVPKVTDLLSFGWSRFYNESLATFDDVKIYDTFSDEPTFTKPQSTGPVQVVGGNLTVNGEPFVAKGVGYQPMPIGASEGETWKAYCDPAVYNRDMPWLMLMGANTIRTWGRVDYGCTAGYNGLLDAANTAGVKVLMGFWVNWNTDYSNPTVRASIKSNFRNYVSLYKNNPAVLGWGIANENNYHTANYKDMYSLFNEMAQEAYLEEGATYHPVVIVNGDLREVGIPLYSSSDADLPYVDIWGANMYPGQSFSNIFDVYKTYSSKPLFVTEFGIDAFDNNTCTLQEQTQADWATALFGEIFANPNTVVGGTLMAYSDEWWKANSNSNKCSTVNMSNFSHNYGGFPGGPFPDSYFNEEWWGIFSIADNGSGPDVLTPRKAYSALRVLFTGDTDGDRCSDAKELGGDWKLGGQRDPNSRWDFWDVPVPAISESNWNLSLGDPRRPKMDGVIGASDAQAVFAYFQAAAKVGNPPKNGISYDSHYGYMMGLTDDPNFTDGMFYDRTPSADPAQFWRTGPPRGIIGAGTAQLNFSIFKNGGSKCK